MRKFWGCLFFALIVGIQAVCFENPAVASDKIVPENTNQTYRVWRVVDGDTLRLADYDERVVLEGLDAPELYFSQKMLDESRRDRETMKNIRAKGRRAKQFTKSLLEGRDVRLEFDQRLRDNHGQLLAYVYTTDGTFANAEMIKQGYAVKRSVPPNLKYDELFTRLEEEAKKEDRGLWPYTRKK